MENNLLERVIENRKMDFVLMKCCQTGDTLSVPEEVYEKVQNGDKSVANKEFAGFYVSPCFCFYKSYSDFRMFCED